MNVQAELLKSIHATHPIGIEFSEDLAFEKSDGAYVTSGTFSGSGAFRKSKNITVKSGDFPGNVAIDLAEGVYIEDGNFSGPNALWQAKDVFVTGGNFSGYAALRWAKRIAISGGNFSGPYALRGAEDVKIIAGNFSGNHAFNGAQNLKCYLPGTIEDLDIPDSGVVAAKKISNYHSGGKATVYAAEFGWRTRCKELYRKLKGKPPLIQKISSSYFNQDVTFENLEETLGSVKNYASLGV